MRKALGRGIDALITKVQDNDISGDMVQRIPVEQVRPNRHQPRTKFVDDSLGELSASIKEHGLMQPISVWKNPQTGQFELIAGERRLRAVKLAGLPEIEAIVRKDLDEEDMLGLSLIENIQREDLNAIDTALAYQRLMETFGVSQAEVAKKMKKSRAAVSNTMRLLDLEDEIRQAIQAGALSEGHARALISVPDTAKRLEFFHRILSEKLSVRATEEFAHSFHLDRPAKERKQRGSAQKSPEVAELESALEKRLGTKVDIVPGSGPQNGKIIVHYYSLDDFDRLTGLLRK